MLGCWVSSVYVNAQYLTFKLGLGYNSRKNLVDKKYQFYILWEDFFFKLCIPPVQRIGEEQGFDEIIEILIHFN